MSNDKVLFPDVIIETPLPGDASVAVPANQSTSKTTQSFTPQKNPETPLPTPVVARHLISDTLNTKTQKILGTYTFGEVGSLKVGKYVNGVSGEVNITPNGITAVNSNGDTTFALDGDTGDATFAGQLLAGTVIAEEIQIIGGRILVNDGVTNRIVIGLI